MTRRSLWLGPLIAMALVADAALTGGVFAKEVDAAEGGHDFFSQFSIFVLAVFVGYYVVWSVTPALHTPLMSVTNAISSVIVVGALLAVAVGAVDTVSSSGHVIAKLLGLVALILASVNIFGGFLVTQRMLSMYRRKDR